MRGTDGAALATVCTEARLAELDAANLPADIAAIAADVAGGGGANTITVTVLDTPTVFEGIRVSASNVAGTLGPYVQFTDTNGQVVFHLADDDWRITAAASAAQSGGYTDVTVTEDDDTVEIAVTEVALPIPAPAGYCAVRCLAETQEGEDATGTFRVADIISPTTRTSAGVTLSVVLGADVATLVAGVATVTVLQGAVCNFLLATTLKTRRWKSATVPATSNADIEDLVLA